MECWDDLIVKDSTYIHNTHSFFEKLATPFVFVGF